MKLSLRNFAFLAMAATAVTLTSCDPDDAPTPVTPNRAPEITFTNTDGSDFDSNIEVPANTSRTVTVVVTDPDDNLDRVTFQRNGQQFLGSAGFVREDLDNNASTPLTNIPANPALIIDAADRGTYRRTFVFSGSTEFNTTTTYTILALDADGLTDEESFQISTQAQPVTRDSVMVMSGKFFNQSGPSFGAFDLITGDSIATSNNTPRSRLQDAGNGGDSAWDRVIIGEGDATIIALGASDLEAYNTSSVAAFDAVAFGDELRDLVSRGTVPATGLGRTRALAQGNSFLVRTGANDDDANGRIYLVNVTRLVDNADNSDFYEIRYKLAPRKP